MAKQEQTRSQGRHAASAAPKSQGKQRTFTERGGTERSHVRGSHKDGDGPKRRSPVRVANGIAAAAITLLFTGHAFLGELSLVFPVPETLKPLVFAGLAAMGLHVILSLATTYVMYTDKERPASKRKKRHQWQKWLTGTAVLLAAGAHMVVMGTPAASLRANGQVGIALALMATTAVLLCVHICTGVKSLTHDLGLSPEWRLPLRALAMSLTVALCLAVVVVLAFGA